MILGALANYYDRLAADRVNTKIPPIGYSYENISYVLILGQDGYPLRFQSLMETSGNRQVPRRIEVPLRERTSGIRPKFLWDNRAYCFGIADNKKELNKKHEEFKKLHFELLAFTKDTQLISLVKFLETLSEDRLRSVPGFSDLTDQDNLIFASENLKFLHNLPEARAIWDKNFKRLTSSKISQCLITGESEPIAELHPSIKGVYKAQSSGAYIFSFNKDAFTSLNKKKALNAPVSAEKAFAYTLALNHMLAGERQKVQIADATTVFWAEAGKREEADAAEVLFGLILSDNARDAAGNATLMAVLDEIAKGRPLKEIDPGLTKEGTKFYVLGLSPNAARIAIRFWQANSFAYFAENFRQHYLDLKIEPQPWQKPPSVWRLLLQTAVQKKSENIPPTLAGAVMRSILSGQPYPQSLFGQILTRIRADRDVNGLRAAILKACIVRRRRHISGTKEDDYLVSLDRNESNEAYRLGRLFAVLETAQRAALGNINATIRDRFYASASATPAAVFPMLLRNSKNHLANLRRGRAADWVKDPPKTGWWLDKEIGGILDGFGPGFPRAFAMEDQGRFAIGYYHQRFSKTADAPQDIQAVTNAAETDNGREGIEE